MKAEFITLCANEPVSYIQASFLIDGRVMTFRQPLAAPHAELVQEAWVDLIAEVKEACDATGY